MASAEAQAGDKNRVLDALGKTASKIRSKLGESIGPVRKFDTPLEQATTSSLEALQAYSLGHRAMFSRVDNAAAILHFQRAINLDPTFAMAYARLGNSYGNLREPARAAENSRKAYELREKVSERERLYIESHYEINVTQNLEAGRRTCDLWAQAYPRDESPPSILSSIYERLGDYDKSLAYEQASLKLHPAVALHYANLVNGYLEADRLEEARAVAQEAQNHDFDSPYLHYNLYFIDFLQHDGAGMKREFSVLMDEPEYENTMLYQAANVAADAGQFVKARELMRQASSSAQRADASERRARNEAAGALRDALAGLNGLAKQEAQSALALSSDQNADVRAAIALVLARLGDSAQATKLADELASHVPENTILQFNFLPSIRAATQLGSGNPRKALDALVPAEPYDLGLVGIGSLQPVYLRGEAYLATGQSTTAAVEFQRILNHPGAVKTNLIGVLAHLQLGRAFAVSGDKIKAKKAYLDFLTLWKDADPDIPILKQAKAEYAKL